MNKKTEKLVRHLAYIRYYYAEGREDYTISVFHKYLDNLIINEIIMTNIYYEDLLEIVRINVVNEIYNKYSYFIENKISSYYTNIKLMDDLKDSIEKWTDRFCSNL